MTDTLMTRNDVLELCARYDACDEAMDWLRSQPDEATAEQLLATCKRTDWMLWLASELGVGDAHAYVRIACEIARSVLHIVPEGETRPLAAIELAERSLTEPVTRYELIAARAAAGAAAQAAARAAGDAAWAVAWAAAWAAADTARDAAGAAARDAAGAAARDAAGAAAWAAYASEAAWTAAGDVSDSQADVVRKYLPLKLWVDACAKGGK